MLLDLGERLRRAGVDVSMGEMLDAVAALGAIDVGDRPLLRAAMRSTLVKRPEDLAVFDPLFERSFQLTRGAHVPDASQVPRLGDPPPSTWRPSTGLGGPMGGSPASASTDYLEALLDALRRGDLAAMETLAAMAVGVHGSVGDPARTERYYLYRVLRALDLSTLLQQAIRADRDDAGPDASALELRLRRDELAERVEAFRRMIADEVRARLAALRPLGVDQPALTHLDDVEFLKASRRELSELRDAVRPLARKLAARVSQRRRRRARGRLDVRRTLRRSLQVGGVPLWPVHRDRRAAKPDLVLLCDVSGSVAEFANFTLSLVHAMHEEFARLRTFVFVDGVAEVTEVIAGSDHSLDPFHLVHQPGVVDGDGHSDYGKVFERFVQRYLGDAVTPATTVIITGDGRTNHRDAGVAALGQIGSRARRLYWFDPEPSEQWVDDDRAIEQYRPVCSGMFEVRTLRQLEAAVVAIV
jgi:uncharacterized protein with von Willebrand factor type A (vWA) domain